MQSKNKIIKNSISLIVIALLGALLSFAKEAVIAFCFGSSETVDAYVIAVDMPITFFTMLSMAVSTVVVPIYTRLSLQKSKLCADDYIGKLTAIVGTISLLIVLVLEIFATPLVKVVAMGLSESAQSLTVSMFRLTLFFSVFAIVVKINVSVLNTQKVFTLPALAAPLSSVAFIILVFLLSEYIGIYAAIAGLLIGVVFEWLFSALLRKKYVNLHLRLDLKDENVKQSFKLSVPVFFGNGIEEINKIVDKAVSSLQVAGSISSLHYASKLTSGISNLLVTGVTTVLFPEYSEMVSRKNEKGIADVYVRSVNVYMMMLIPLTVGGFFLSKEIVSLIYERGAFTASDVVDTAPLFVGYLISIIFTSIRQTTTSVFNAYEKTKIPMINTSIGVGLNIILNIVLAKFFGVVGIVASTIISSAITAILLMISVKKENEFIHYKTCLISLCKTVGASACMGLSLWGVIPLLSCLFGDDSVLHKILFLICAIIIGVLVYVICLFLFKTDELMMIVKKIKKR